MIETGIDTRVKVNQILQSQLPEYIVTESPKTLDFLKQYYISQDAQGNPADLIDDLDQYLNFNNLSPEALNRKTELTAAVDANATTINVVTTKGYPNQDGIFQIDDEIIYYTGITTNSFTGCVRGFSGATDYNSGELVFKETSAAAHSNEATVTNLSTLFLQEFFRNLKVSFAPGFEDETFDSNLNVNNFIKNLRSFYNAKGTNESFNIIINALFGKQSSVTNQVDFLLQPSAASYRSRRTLVAEAVSGDPLFLSGQTLFQDADPDDLSVIAASAPISEVETVIRGSDTYYNIYLFSRFSDPAPGFTGQFSINASSKVIGTHGSGASVITVDTTIGFPKSGSAKVGDKTITYTDKTINQFLNVTGADATIPSGEEIRTNNIAYAYSSKDGSKVELRVTGVIDGFESNSDIVYSDLGEIYRTKTVGRKIKNPLQNKTNKQIVFNSWVYNTAPRIEVEQFAGSTFTLKLDIDKAYLRTGDKVEVLNRANDDVEVSSADVFVVGSKTITLSGAGIGNLVAGRGYDIRRHLKKATSTGIPLDQGDGVLTANIQNTYVDKDDTEIFVASNSLPDYTIGISTIKSEMPSATVSAGALRDPNPLTGKYKTLSFSSSVPFITGDEIVYTAGTSTDPIDGLEFGKTYYVNVLTPNNRIKLHVARSFIAIDQGIEIGEPINDVTGSHEFVLAEQYNRKIATQKLLKKFSLRRSEDTGSQVKTIAGSTGMLINGVEVANYKSDNKIFFGPLDSINIINNGDGYDVVEPPTINVSNPVSGGTTAQAYASIKGSLKDIFIDPQKFSINKVNSISVTGGNGGGVIVEPVVEDVFREVGFNAKYDFDNGGVSAFSDSIRFIDNHGFGDGEAIVYNPQGNASIPITGFGQTVITGNFLETGGVYFSEVISPTEIRLYETEGNYNSGINTVGFSTGGKNGGIQNFRLRDATKALTGVNILDAGSNFETRKVAVSTVGVTTVTNTFEFTNHGYSDGELVTYEASISGFPIGLSTSDQYFVVKVDDNNFKVSNAGAGGTNRTNYERGIVSNITGIGSGYHIFNYPPVTVDVNVSIANTVGVVTATPIITGEIQDILVYDKGSSYGSSILNFEKKPIVTVLNGTGAEFQAVVKDGRIVQCNVTDGGKNYFSPPDLVITSPTGAGAKLRSITNGKGNVIDVVVISKGANYNLKDTFVTVKARGNGVIFNPRVRGLTINNRFRYDSYSGEMVLNRGEDIGLQFATVGYNDNARNEFGDTNQFAHSPLIGWAYDGNPIYGAYAYTDPNDAGSEVKKIESGYQLDTTQLFNRPDGFASGLFIEDYFFDGDGDLDIHNGRFSKTPDYPNGIYAYYATLESDPLTGNEVSSFPYFVGNTYRSGVIPENLAGGRTSLDQDFDFNSSNLLRNTFPYIVSEQYGGYDFYVEPYELDTQRIETDAILPGSIENINVVESGDEYRVGDNIVFNDSGTGGGGASAEIQELLGKNVESIENEFLDYQDITFERISAFQVAGHISTYHDLAGSNVVEISGLSTFVSGLSGDKVIGVPGDSFFLADNMPAEPIGGMVTDIQISPIPEYLDADGFVSIDDEELKVLNVYRPNNAFSDYTGVIRAVRGTTGSGHTIGAAVTAKSSSFVFDLPGDVFDSRRSRKVYFDPQEVIGSGRSTGEAIDRPYTVNGVTTNRSIPVQSIYIEDHPFSHNQKAIFTKPSSATFLSISTVSTGSTSDFPFDGNLTQEVYISKKSANYIGIKTSLHTDELYFVGAGTSDYQHSLESINTKVTGRVRRITAKVSTAATHGLAIGDRVDFNVKPNLSTGVGTDANVKVTFNDDIQNILFNPIGFGSTAVGLATSKWTVNHHNLDTGDLIFYDANEVPGGIDTGKYFVYVIDENNFQLAETLNDLALDGGTRNIIKPTSIGGTSHTISRVNPSINIIKNNNVVFDLVDTSLDGFRFKFFYDQQFRNQLVGTGNSSTFEVGYAGTVGSGTSTPVTATVTFNDELPVQLFYNLERISNNTLVEPDTSLTNHSRVLYSDSVYSGQTVVSGVTSTTFLINLEEIPENDGYTKSQCDKLEYKTRSKTAFGGISKINIVSGGDGYRQLPGISTINSTLGRDGQLELQSSTVGALGGVVIKKAGFDFSKDKTLRPVADIPTYYDLKESNKLQSITPIFGGRDFVSEPELVLVNSITKKEIPDTEIIPDMASGSIEGVQIILSPSGLAGVGHSVYSVLNSNGITVTKVDSVNTGIATLTLRTPVLGFATNPFKAGDEIFIDGIQEYTGTGQGFNSRDYGFRFFNVKSYNGGVIPSTVTIDYAGIATNPGVAVTDTNQASVVQKEKYPTFDVVLEEDGFISNEPIIVQKGTNQVETDLTVTKSEGTILKTFGDYELVDGDRITGKFSRTKATINNIIRFDGFYDVDSNVNQNFGWTDDLGFLNSDYQVIPNNDYYQKLAYSIKSPIEFKDIIDPVNRMAHIAGTKNFADTQISSSGIAITNFVEDASQTLLIDIQNESDTTTQFNFDFAVDIDVVDPTLNTESTTGVAFGRRKLTNYIECKTNRVLQVDDISPDFINQDNLVGGYKDIIAYPSGTGYSRFTVLVTAAADLTLYEVHDLVVLSDGNNNVFTFTKLRTKSDGQFEPDTEEEKETLGTIQAIYEAGTATVNLRFTPSNPKKTYDIKIFRQLFDSRTSGIGSYTVGDTELFGSTTTIGAGATSHLIGVGVTDFHALFAYVEATDTTSQERNYAEVTLLQNEQNTVLSEYGFNTDDRNILSFNPLGSFGSSIDNEVVHLNYHNQTQNEMRVKASIIGFTTTNVGLRTVHFKTETQEPGLERSARIQSNVIEVPVQTTDVGVVGYGITVVGISSLVDRTYRSVMRIGIGETSYVTQLFLSQDPGTKESIITEYPSTGINTAIGLGTFSAEFKNTQVELYFNPDRKYEPDTIRIHEFSEILYQDQEGSILQIPEFGYGTGIKEVVQNRYIPSDKLDFELTYKGTPIFARRFNPGNTSIFDQSTGNIKLLDHFLFSGQALKYKPGSSITGINSTAIGIGTTLAGGSDTVGNIRVGSKQISAASTELGMTPGFEIIGPGVSAGSTIVSIGSTFRYFFGNSDGTAVITGVAYTGALAIGDTIRELQTETGFGTITSIGINSITVENNVPVGVGSTYYSERLGIAVSMSQVATADTTGQTFTSGISTDVLPEDLFAIRIDNNNLKLATKRDFALKGQGISPTNVGEGNNHLIDTTKKLEKTLFTVDGVVQNPIARTSLEYNLEENIGTGVTFFALSGIGTITSEDILKVNDEFMNILNVGLGTTNRGPITGIGTFNLVNVERGYVGTDGESHNNQDRVTLFKGAYNIVESTVHFVEAPIGPGADFLLDDRNIPFTRSTFSGRVYLRQDYSTNEVYDDISPEFTGIAKTFGLTVNKQVPVGIETAAGSGVLFINGVHQGQTTDNNPSNVYSIVEQSVEFSGTKLETGDPFISPTDPVLNQLPKGGVVVSVASSGGTGIAPLNGAKVRANVGAGGSITEIVGIDTVGTYTTITGFVYDGVSGIGTVTTAGAHNFKVTDFIDMRNIEFECTKGYDELVGISTIDYDNVSGIMTVTTSEDHNLNKDMRVNFHDLTFECTKSFDSSVSIADAEYDPASGIMTVTTSGNHNLNRGMQLRLSDIEFSCASPHLGVTTTIFPDGTNGRIFNEVHEVVSSTEFSTMVGISTIAHTYQSGGLVESGITTTVFPSDLGIQWAISGADYTASTGVMTVTTKRTHNLTVGEFARIADIEFSCTSEHAGVTTTIFPDTIIDEFEITDVPSASEFTVNVGISTIAHTYVDHGYAAGVKVKEGYFVQSIVGPTTFTTYAYPVGFAHTYVGGGLVDTGFTTTRFPDPRGIPFAIANFEYDKATGISTITTKKNHSGIAKDDVVTLSGIAMTCLAYNNEIGLYDFDYTASTGVSTILTLENHGLSDGDLVMIRDVEFTCSSEHLGVTTTIFPDGTQGFIFNVNAGSAGTTLVTNVGISTIGHDYVSGTGKIRTGITTSIFPDSSKQNSPFGSDYPVLAIPAANKLIVKVGISTIDHIYDDHGIVFGKKWAGPYTVKTVVGVNTFEVDVLKVGFAHTYVPSRRKGAPSGEVAEYYQGLNFGQGYYGPITVEVEEKGHTGSAATITARVADNNHRFESSKSNAISVNGWTGSLTPTAADYDPLTGIMTMTIVGHGLTSGDEIGIKTESLTFSCYQDDYNQQKTYPREVTGRGVAEPSHGTLLSIASTTTDTVTVDVGHAQGGRYSGGKLEFDVFGPGTGYTNPTIHVQDPSYANLGVEGVSRLGIGATTATGTGFNVSLIVGAGSTAGIAATETFQISNYVLNRRGFGFKKFDIFKPVGLVTGAYPSVRGGVGYAGTFFEDFTLEVLEVQADTFSSWNFGQIDYIDSVKSLQNGVRTRFPLNLNGVSLSFQRDETDQISSQIDLDAVLLLFVNGVIQVPKKDYFFEGGTSFNFNFTSPPLPEDVISIYFYRGTRGVDSALVNIFETLKPGDDVQILKYDPFTVPTQKPRKVFAITDSEEIETNIYKKQGIDQLLFRPITLTKQKKDLVISQEIQYKVRDALEPQIMPIGKVIKDFGPTDTEIFLDNATFFQYEEDAEGSNFGEVVADAFIVDYLDPRPAQVTSTISGGVVTGLTIVDAGNDYPDGDVELNIGAPSRVDNSTYGIVGVGSTATATASASGGIVTSVTLTSGGYGYNVAPQVITEVSVTETDTISDASVIVGYSGIITGITTTTGTDGHPLALKFQLDLSESGSPTILNSLLEGYPVMVKNTTIGHGITSVDDSDSAVIGIGTTVCNNIYYAHQFSVEGNTGIITSNIHSATDVVALGSTTGDFVGEFSWGKLSEFTRSGTPITLTVSGKQVDVGLTTFPSATRRGLGLRNTGNIAKKVAI